MPDPNDFIEYDDDGNDIYSCWNCAGEGTAAICEEEWACLYPEEGCELCTRPCDICNGEGSFAIRPAAAETSN